MNLSLNQKWFFWLLVLLIFASNLSSSVFAQEVEAPNLTPIPFVVPEGSMPSNLEDLDLPASVPTGSFDDLRSIEANTSAVVQQPVNFRPLKKAFRADEQVTVILDYVKAKDVQVSVFNADGLAVPVTIEEISDSQPAAFTIRHAIEFKPGRYRVKVQDITSGAVLTQEFVWGVLAINPNKSIYFPSETAKLHMAVLDEIGMMVCDAVVKLNIKNQILNIDEELSTENGKIKINPECTVKDYTEKPDYEASYQVGGAGEYRMTLTATTKNGTYTVTDAFEVRDNVAFDVERTSATRIFPPVRYPVKLTVTAQEDFSGTVTEVVPEGFAISQLAGVYQFSQIATMSAIAAQQKVLGAADVRLGLPYKGRQILTQGFGALEKDPILKAKYQKYGVLGHDGIDFALASGTEVIAVDTGTIVRARENSDYGTTVVIQHTWGKSYYGHLSKLLVKEGDVVKKGDTIGLSGNTGLSTAPHLHFGIKFSRNDFNNGYFGKVNPLSYMDLPKEDAANPVVLTRQLDSTSAKVITWNVSLRKGESVTLGYSYLAPQESPQFYLLGPLEFREQSALGVGKGPVVFSETRQWQIAADIVANNGRLYYGDQTNTALRFQTHTSPFTFNGELSFTHGGTASLIAHTVAKAAPTRDEIMVGSLKVDGQLMVVKGVNGYDVGTDYSLAWTNSGTTGAQTCNSATEVDCTRAFDITYERLSGRAMVVYADTTNQKLYYCYWDGTAWGPQSACIPTNGTNDITLTSNGRPDFVTLKAKGGTNEILLGVSVDVGGVHEVETFIWDGSAWGTNDLATSTTNASVNTIESGQVFDIEWESNSGDAVVVWGTTTAGSTLYRLKPSGGAWGADTTGPALVGGDGVINTMNLDADPASNRIAFASTDSANDGNLGIWKADGSTTGWTMGNEDTTLANDNPGTQYADVVWQKSGSVAMWFAQTAINAVDLEYQTATCNGTGCTFSAIDTTIPLAGVDDATYVRLAASPNSDEIMALWSHIDRDVYAQHWNGSAWEAAASAALEVDTSPGTADNTVFNGMSAAFTYIPYSAWSRNWKFFQGTDTTDTPTNQLAAENTAPTGFVPETGKFRLRFSVIELSGMGQTDARKKLQYTSGCDPNTSESACSWTDVDNVGGSGIWRYVDCNGGSAVCDDNTTLAGTTLSGTPTAGWWTQSKDAAGGTVMDHSALQLRELEYSVAANNASGTTTYYFRMYDVDQDKAVRREQDNDGANDCAVTTCTYPSLTTTASSGPTNDQLLRHGMWFSSGVEQPFTF